MKNGADRSVRSPCSHGARLATDSSVDLLLFGVSGVAFSASASPSEARSERDGLIALGVHVRVRWKPL
jgi:hypothetical protein